MRRRAQLIWGIGILAGAVALGALVVIGIEQPSIDSWWNTLMVEHRMPWLVAFANVMNSVGGGWIAVFVVPPGVVVALLLARRWRAAVFAGAAFLLSAGIVQVLKHLFGRARPEEMLVLSDFGSFPSGHTANAATIALVVWLLFPRVWTALLGVLWVFAMAYSRTVLSVHWLSDTLGGALAGAAVTLLLAAVMLPWVQRQGRAPERVVG